MKHMMFLAMAMCTGPTGMAQAQSVTEMATTPTSILTDLETLGRLDGSISWAVDLNSDGTTDVLTQATFTSGGNSVYLRYFIYHNIHKPTLQIELPLQGGILSIDNNDATLTLRMYRYQDGDARCCPSGEDIVTLRH
jgi:hypothetical protein